ncbi:MAG: alpha/beta hydrolase, partial [Clostridia bacterium]|nr:alpha/beta hydrolase [Clostridia bacterium]
MKFIIKKFWKAVDKMDKKRISSQTAPQGLVTLTDIPYMAGGNPMHTLDIYYKEGVTEAQPVIFDIHGGGWVYGSKELNKYFCMDLALRGFTVVNINYRLTTEAVFPTCVKDIFAALEWICKEGKKYYADTDKMCVAGDSAGAHLALITAIVTKNAELQRELNIAPVADIKALGLICGAFDIEKYMKLRIMRGYQKLIFGDDYT